MTSTPVGSFGTSESNTSAPLESVVISFAAPFAGAVGSPNSGFNPVTTCAAVTIPRSDSCSLRLFRNASRSMN